VTDICLCPVVSVLCLGNSLGTVSELTQSPSVSTVSETDAATVSDDAMFGDFDEPNVAPRGDGG